MKTITTPGSARGALVDAGTSDADAEYSTRVGVSRRERYVSTYAELSRHIQALGLLERQYAYYWIKIIGLVLAFAAIWVVFALLGDSVVPTCGRCCVGGRAGPVRVPRA